MVIDFTDFLKLDIRAGTICAVESFPAALHPAYKLFIDFGPEIGTKKSSAQITEKYTPDTLTGRQIAAVVNFPPKQIGKFMSEVLVLGFADENGHVTLVTPMETVPNGARLY